MIEEQLVTLISRCVRQAVTEAMEEHDRRTTPAPKYLTPGGVSERSNLSKQTIYQRHSNGTIPGAVRDGGKLLFVTEVIDRWVAAGMPKDISRF